MRASGVMAYVLDRGCCSHFAFTFTAPRVIALLHSVLYLMISIPPIQSFPKKIENAVEALKRGTSHSPLPRKAAQDLRLRGIVAVDPFRSSGGLRSIHALLSAWPVWIADAPVVWSEYKGRKACSWVSVACTSFSPQSFGSLRRWA